MSIALQHSLNDLLSHDSDAEMSPLSDGGLEKYFFSSLRTLPLKFVAELMDHPVCTVGGRNKWNH